MIICWLESILQLIFFRCAKKIKSSFDWFAFNRRVPLVNQRKRHLDDWRFKWSLANYPIVIGESNRLKIYLSSNEFWADWHLSWLVWSESVLIDLLCMLNYIHPIISHNKSIRFTQFYKFLRCFDEFTKSSICFTIITIIIEGAGYCLLIPLCLV